MSRSLYSQCTLCPRKCNADRTVSTGFCGMSDRLFVAKAYLHKWEEPCFSVINGAGTVFFSGCNLKCCFCQNHAISFDNFGTEVSSQRLSEIFLSLQEQGADNIELVTASHFVPSIIEALDRVRHKLNIPVIYNCGGYESVDTIRLLDRYVDIFLPDLKYYSSESAEKYSKAPDYFRYASEAVIAMTEQAGKLVFGSNGALLKGTVIRHLVLPGQRHDSMKILKWISENVSPDKALLSLMSQYTPFDFIPDEYREIKRKVTKMEYNSVVKLASELGLKGYMQDINSASEKYVPDFDLSGV